MTERDRDAKAPSEARASGPADELAVFVGVADSVDSVAFRKSTSMVPFPFSALGLADAVVETLLVALVDPLLGGVLLTGAPGTGKSFVLRSLTGLAERAFGRVAVRLPFGIDDEGLFGGVDLEGSLAQRKIVRRAGVLERAVGHPLVVHGLDRLDRRRQAWLRRRPVADEGGALTLATAEATPVKSSTVHESRSALPSESRTESGAASPGALASAVTGSFAITVSFETRPEITEALRRLAARWAFDADVVAFRRRFEASEAHLVERLRRARERLDDVALGDDVVREIAEAAATFAVEGDQATIDAVRFARAAAASRGADAVGSSDTVAAIARVLAPRRRRFSSTGDDATSSSQSRAMDDLSTNAAASSKSSDSSVGDSRLPEGSNASSSGSSVGESVEGDLVTNAAAIDNDETNDDTNDGAGRSPSTAETIIAPGPAGEFDLGVANERLQAASTTSVTGRGTSRRRGATGTVGRMTTRPVGRSVAVAATLRRAAMAAVSRGERMTSVADTMGDRPSHRLRIRIDDVVYRERRRRCGTLFVFAVDASGSMATGRMREAKGAVLRLLERAYRRRDAVALIAFRRTTADVLLEPTSAVARARRELEVLPAGGGTPLATGLEAVARLASRETSHGRRPVRVLLVTDGRPNVARDGRSHRATVHAEIEALAATYRMSTWSTLVVDPRPSFDARDHARHLASRLGAEYVHLPGGAGDRLARLARKS